MNKKKGFTLIEILTVIIIIGVLSSVAIPQYRRVIQKSYVSQALSLMRVMYDSSERLALAKGYKDYASMRKADTDAKISKLGMMDMFDNKSIPDGCSVSTDGYKLTCTKGDALKAFSYKVDATWNSGASSGVVAKKETDPFKGTYLIFNRNDGKIYCQGDEAACDLYGFEQASFGLSF